MSDTPDSQTEKEVKPAAPKSDEKPSAEATAATPSKAGVATAEKPADAQPATVEEPPFTTDPLQSSTARFTHKAWYLYYNNRNDMDFIRKTPVRATLEARTSAGAEEIHKILTDAGVREISRNDKVLSLTATFEMIQSVIRHPQTYRVDAVKI